MIILVSTDLSNLESKRVILRKTVNFDDLQLSFVELNRMVFKNITVFKIG